MQGNLGWLPTNCTAELDQLCMFTFMHPFRKKTPRTHSFYFVNMNSFNFARATWFTHVFQSLFLIISFLFVVVEGGGL